MIDALDFSIEAMDASGADLVIAPSDPWLARRALGFGASDLPSLLLALRIVDAPAPDYLERRARVTNRTRGRARIIAEKAGLVAPYASGRAAARGTARERELLIEWRRKLEHGAFYCAAERLIDPARVRHSDVAMRCAMPWVDRRCPILTATLDAWGDDVLGAEVAIELKCTMGECRDLPWWWRTQVQAQLAVTDAPYGLVVCGEQWVHWSGHDGPIRSWLVERDEVAIGVLRDAARAGWDLVSKLREEMEQDA